MFRVFSFEIRTCMAGGIFWGDIQALYYATIRKRYGFVPWHIRLMY